MVLVRHGETEWSRSRRHTSRTDLPLLPAGIQEAKAIREILAGRAFSQVLTSPLRRAAETCQLAGFGEQARTNDDLREWDYGDYEGLTTTEIAATQPSWTIWTGGTENGETIGDVARRADRVIARARSRPGDTLCFAHGHFLRVLAARWLELPPVAGKMLALSAGSVSELGWEHSYPVVDHWNRVF